MKSEKFSCQSELKDPAGDWQPQRGRPAFGKTGIKGTSREEIGNEQDRAARVRKLGLSEDASWGEIFDFMDEQERAVMAKELDLTTYPGAKKYGLSEYPSWRNILTAIVGLHSTASVEDIIEKVKTIRRVGKER